MRRVLISVFFLFCFLGGALHPQDRVAHAVLPISPAMACALACTVGFNVDCAKQPTITGKPAGGTKAKFLTPDGKTK